MTDSALLQHLAFQRFADLQRQRNETTDPTQQARLGPLEHGAFTEAWVRQNPIVAVPSLIAGIPVYNAAKGLGIARGRSPAGLDAMAEAYRGMWRGLGLMSPAE